MRRRSLLTMVLLAGALLAGCGTDAARTGSAAAPLTSTAQQDPSTLVGLWAVKEAGEDPGTFLGIGTEGVDKLHLWKKCGRSSGSWQADSSGLLLTVLDSIESAYPGSGQTLQCPESVADTPWLTRATGYRADNADRLLLDVDGKVLARLTPAPKADLPTDSSIEIPVPVTEPQRAAMSRPAPPLPRGYRPATRTSMPGRWEAAHPRADFATAPYADVEADGTWRGHDGCTSDGGLSNVGPDGAALTSQGPGLLIGCEPEGEVSLLPGGIRRAGFDGRDLVLFDDNGDEVRRLRRVAIAAARW